MQKQSVAFSKHASNLFFHILTKCNLSCRHCYINREQQGDKTLDLKTIVEWLELFSQKGKPTNLILLGGEPTLHPDLSHICKAARRLKYNSVTIDTNGYLFHDILERLTNSEVDFFSFSLDGATRQTNDAIRGKGSYEACLAGIEQARKKGFSTSMIYTASRHNFHELSMMPDLVKNIGIQRFFIQVIGIRGESSSNSGAQQISKESWLSTVPNVAENIAKHGITVTYPKVFLETHETFTCAALVSDNFFVFPNGRVYRCPLCEDFPIHSLEIINKKLYNRKSINETDLFQLTIPEGCVMNKIVQPENIVYTKTGTPAHKIACCLLKEEIRPPGE